MLTPNAPANSNREIIGGASFMVAYQLYHKHVLVIGGGREAANRTFYALDSSAKVTLISANVSHPIVQKRINDLQVRHLNRNFKDEDLDQRYPGFTEGHAVDMVLCCIDDHKESRRIAMLCKARRIPINCADIPALCDFYFCAQWREDQLQIAVSTNGGGPRLGAKIRNDIVKKLDINSPKAVTQASIIREKIRDIDEFELENSLQTRMGWISRFTDSWNLAQLASLENEKLQDEVLTAYRNGENFPAPPEIEGGGAYMPSLELSPMLTSVWWCPNTMGYKAWLNVLIGYPLTVFSKLLYLVQLHLTLIWSFRNLNSNEGVSPVAENSKIDLEMEEIMETGTITLVGAGPGNPDMLTIQAVQAIKDADIVVSDRLVAPEIINLIPRPKLILSNFKIGGASDQAQNETNEICISEANKGKHVVRLKTGDPFVYGRGGEEFKYFKQNGIEATIISGVSSVFGALSSCNIPATYRDVADQVLILSGRGKGGSYPNIPHYYVGRTTIILMSLSRIQPLVDLLLEQGYPKDIPCAVIEKGSWLQGEKICEGILHNISKLVLEDKISNPAMLVVGFVCSVLK